MFKNQQLFRVSIILFLALGFFLPQASRADVCTQNTTVDVVARDPSGTFIPSASVDLYTQGTDANNNPKPATHIAGGTTDAVLGTVHLSFKNSAATTANYALRIRTVGKDSTSFWYYNLSLTCGQSASIDKTLSGINFIIHDENGNLLQNASFSVYSQLYDANNSAVDTENEQLASLNSGSSGSVKVYLPQGSVRSIDGTIDDYYVLDLTHNGVKFTFFGIKVVDGQLTTVNYYLSALHVKLQDATGALFPSGTNVDVFKQEVGTNNDREQGAKVGSFTIGNDGYGTFQAPAGLYVLGVKGNNGVYQYFWDTEVVDGQSTEYDYTVNQSTNTTSSCQNNSQFTLVLRNFSGDIAPGLKFSIYEQGQDANGLPIAGNQVGGGTIDNSGQSTLNFRPNPTKSYALKVWDKRADLGEFWFFNAVKFVCDYSRTATEYLPALKIVLRDGQGQLRRNYNFSLYAQEYDADNRPYFSSSDLIANLQTDGGGQALVYVAPYNPYRRGQTGSYALSAKDANGNVSNFYNINISSTKDYTFESTFSGVSGDLRDAQSRLIANREIHLYEQNIVGGSYGLGHKLLVIKTDANGHFQFEYPAGTYAIAPLDDFGQESVFWNFVINAGSNSKRLTTGLVNFSLADGQGEGISSSASLSIYALTDNGNGSYYRGSQVGTVKLSSKKTAISSLAAGAYLAVYVGKGNLEYGQAFTAKNGLNEAVKVIVSSKYLVSSGQSFQVSGGAAVVSSTSTNVSTISPAHTLSQQLAGRILLQVQAQGQAWYVNPSDGKKYYLGRPSDAFNVMRRFGLGISNSNFVAVENSPGSWRRLAGKILIKTEDSGKAYYFDPITLQLYYLGRPSDAFNVMRTRGLGVTNNDLNTIITGN